VKRPVEVLRGTFSVVRERLSGVAGQSERTLLSGAILVARRFPGGRASCWASNSQSTSYIISRGWGRIGGRSNNHAVFATMPVERLAALMNKPGITYDLWNHFSSAAFSLPEGRGYMPVGSHSRFSLA
jgi:hypothetical protein